MPVKPESQTHVLLSLQESAEYLGVSTKSIRRYIASGELAAHRIGGSRLVRIRSTDLDEMLRPIPTGLDQG